MKTIKQIINIVLSGLLLSGCQTKPLPEKTPEDSAYLLTAEKLFAKYGDYQLLDYSAASEVMVEIDKENVIIITWQSGATDSFTISCYLDFVRKDVLPDNLDLDFFVTVVNKVARNKIEAGEIREFVGASDKKYPYKQKTGYDEDTEVVSAKQKGQSAKKENVLTLTIFNSDLGGVFEISGPLAQDKQQLTDFNRLTEYIAENGYLIKPQEYRETITVSYQENSLIRFQYLSSPEQQGAYPQSVYIYWDKQLADEKEKKDFNLSLLSDFIKTFTGIQLSEKSLADFLYATDDKYNDIFSGEGLLEDRYHSSGNMDFSYQLEENLTERLALWAAAE